MQPVKLIAHTNRQHFKKLFLFQSENKAWYFTEIFPNEMLGAILGESKYSPPIPHSAGYKLNVMKIQTESEVWQSHWVVQLTQKI